MPKNQDKRSLYESLLERCTSDESSIAFHTQLQKFIKDMAEQYPQRDELISLYVSLNSNMINDVKTVVSFIVHILPHKEQILNKKHKYLLSDKVLGGFLTPLQVRKVRFAWSKVVRKNDRDIIWRWMTIFIHFASVYAKNNNITTII